MWFKSEKLVSASYSQVCLTNINTVALLGLVLERLQWKMSQLQMSQLHGEQLPLSVKHVAQSKSESINNRLRVCSAGFALSVWLFVGLRPVCRLIK